MLGALVLDLPLEDELNQVLLVLEVVTLGTEVQIVVQMLIQLLGVPVALEQVAENSSSSHPQNLLWHTGISRTTALTVSSVTSLKCECSKYKD